MRKIITASFTNQVLQLRKKNVSTAKIAKQLHASYDTIINAIHLLKKQGLLPEFHSLDPRVKDSNGKTFHTKQLDLLIFNLLKVNHKLHNREIVELLAEQQRLNKKISILTVERSRLRLIKEGLLNRRIATPAETLKIDMQVEKLRLRGLTNSEIASRLGLSVPRVKSGLYRLVKKGKIMQKIYFAQYYRDYIKQKVDENTEHPINLAEIAKELGISREWARQLYMRVKTE